MSGRLSHTLGDGFATATARLAWLLFPHLVADTDKLLMFAAYFDDSGTHDETGESDGSQVTVAAGYVGSPEEWDVLERDWNDLLHRESIPFYHSVDCAHQSEHFTGRTKQDCQRIHKNTIEIITARKLIAVGAALNTGPYFRQLGRPREDGARHVDKHGYINCLWNAWRALGSYMALVAPADQTAIVLEQSPKLYESAMVLYDIATQKTPSWEPIRERFAGPPTFRPKLGHPQLQVADVLAYEMGVKLRRQFIPGQDQFRRRSWDALARHAVEHSSGLVLLRFAEYPPTDT